MVHCEDCSALITQFYWASCSSPLFDMGSLLHPALNGKVRDRSGLMSIYCAAMDNLGLVFTATTVLPRHLLMARLPETRRPLGRHTRKSLKCQPNSRDGAFVKQTAD